jgi:acyl-coenzyme A synthetase/AMP-(fatty) acid ligase
VNFATEVVGAVSPSKTALVALSADGSRRELSFGEVSERAARLAGTLTEHGAARGSVVMTVIGNRAEWVETMVACFQIGAVALPCTGWT